MKIIFGDAAKAELESAVDWYELQKPGLGKRFAQALDLTAKRISSYPSISFELTKGIRRAVISGFPYGIIYSVKEEFIEIIAIAHLHRNPIYWKKRIM